MKVQQPSLVDWIFPCFQSFSSISSRTVFPNWPCTLRIFVKTGTSRPCEEHGRPKVFCPSQQNWLLLVTEQMDSSQWLKNLEWNLVPNQTELSQQTHLSALPLLMFRESTARGQSAATVHPDSPSSVRTPQQLFGGTLRWWQTVIAGETTEQQNIYLGSFVWHSLQLIRPWT